MRGQAGVASLPQHRFLKGEMALGVSHQILQNLFQGWFAVPLQHGSVQLIDEPDELLVLCVDLRDMYAVRFTPGKNLRRRGHTSLSADLPANFSTAAARHNSRAGCTR